MPFSSDDGANGRVPVKSQASKIASVATPPTLPRPVPAKRAKTGGNNVNGQAPAEKMSKSSDLGRAVKREKTGGRVRLSLAEKIQLAVQRSQISSLNDDTTLESELAALYLGVSEKKLEELRKPPTQPDGPFRYVRLPFVKIFDENAKGRNQPVQYKLGDLRAFQRHIQATDTFEAAVNAGLAAWMRTSRPFFVDKNNVGRTVILADAWNLHEAKRDQLFEALVLGKISVVWMSSATAAIALWSNFLAHRNFAERGIRLMYRAIDSMDNAVLFTKESRSISSELADRDLRQ